MTAFTDVAEVRADPRRAWVYEHGWQSWSPAGRYPATGHGPRPRRSNWQTMAFRPERPPAEAPFQGEGLVAIEDGEGATTVWSAPDPRRAIPSIRVRALADRLIISADGEAVQERHEAPIPLALEAHGTALVRRLELRPPPRLPPGWCSWYAYWGAVTEDDVLTNLAAIDRLGLDVAAVQVDDGHQAGIGDWLERSPRFGPLRDLAARIRATGRQAGIWIAPFAVGARSRLAAGHPGWLVRGALACERHWGQQVGVLDVTHPEAAAHLQHVFRTLAADGFTYFKLDFLYAGAMAGGRHGDATPLAAYRHGLTLIRDAVGPDATIVGCGAPLLPSVGLVDAMRVSPDIDLRVEPADGDLSQPSQRAALAAGRARAWMHGRLWVNDPDCVLVRPAAERREVWAEHLDAYGGLAVSSDPLDALDEAGLAWTRRLLRPSHPESPRWDPDAGPDQGVLRPAAARASA